MTIDNPIVFCLILFPTHMRTLPEEFVKMLRKSILPSPDALIQSLSTTDPTVSLRLNPGKQSDGTFSTDGLTPVPWSEGMGFYLDKRPKFTLDPLLHAGTYYVQDASSMIIAHIIKQITSDNGPVIYLDACAAPGGKTTAAISSLPEDSLIVANEFVPSRATILKENLIKWGSSNTVISVGDTSRFKDLPDLFDIVAADVPCSGEGMMRKDTEAIAQWGPDIIQQCADRQKEIITNLWPSLKPGGWLIYSTCTFNRTENEDMVSYIAERFGAEIQDLNFPQEWGIYTNRFGARFLPHLLNGEGLFVAVLRKPIGQLTLSLSDNIRTSKKKVNRKGDIRKGGKGVNVYKSLIDNVRDWLTMPDSFEISVRDNLITAFPQSYSSILSVLESKLKIIYSGITVAEIKGRDLIPTHQLALSVALRREKFPSIDLDLDSAIDYLRKESPSVSLLKDMPKAHILMTYKGIPLGWIKNIGSRANNLYPKEWKILH